MHEFIVIGTQNGRSNTRVRVFASSAGEAVNIAFRQHGFTSYMRVEKA